MVLKIVLGVALAAVGASLAVFNRGFARFEMENLRLISRRRYEGPAVHWLRVFARFVAVWCGVVLLVIGVAVMTRSL